MSTVIEDVGVTATVHRLYELIDANDIPAMLDLFADDATYHRPGYDPILGRVQLERFYRQDRIIREGEHTPAVVLANGSDVAVHGRFRGVLKSGEPLELRYAEFFTMAPDGRFASRQTYFFAPLA